ncbi:MAG: hypothetical protein WCH98_22135 [Verrucomicrobiota bacterium]
MTHRTTFALDDGAVSRLKKLSTLCRASHAEVVRRSLEIAESSHAQGPDIPRRLDAASQLRARLKSRKINVDAWMRAARESRRWCAMSSAIHLDTNNRSDFKPFLAYGLELVRSCG